MGQYYKPINLDKKQYVYSHDFGNGLKLMEHSWVGNQFVGIVEALIAEGGAWHGDRIVWSGDYADPEKGKTKRVPDWHQSDAQREADRAAGKKIKMITRKLNLFDLIDEDVKKEMKIKPCGGKSYRYVINTDTKEFVDTKKIPLSDVYTDNKGKEWPFQIHPLPILTCEGNGRGGGDLHKESPLVGIWARARVTVSNLLPKAHEGYKEIEFNLYEGEKPAQFKKQPKPKKAKVLA
jgi:hypothetical protein